MDEIFRPIKGYEGLYEISNLGRVKNVNRNKILAQKKNRCGYMRVNLSKDHRVSTKVVHRLVADAFIPNIQNKPQVNHINEDKTDNRAENLEWVTAKENVNHGTRNTRMRLKKSKPIICIDTGLRYSSIRGAAREIGISESTIVSALTGKCKTAAGYHWKYDNKEENQCIIA